MIIFWIGICTAVIIGIFTLTRAKKSAADPTLKQIANTIEEFLNGTGGIYDWHDFVTHHSYKDPNLEKIRTDCADIAKKFPPEPGNEKSWCSELGKNELLRISEQVSEEANKAIEARKKAAAEARAKQPAAGKSPMGKAPMMGKGPAGRSPMGRGPMGRGPINKGPAIKPTEINPQATSAPQPAAPAISPAITNQPAASVPTAVNPPAVQIPMPVPVPNAPQTSPSNHQPAANTPPINPPAA